MDGWRCTPVDVINEMYDTYDMGKALLDTGRRVWVRMAVQSLGEGKCQG